MNKSSFNLYVKNFTQYTLKFFIIPLSTLLLISRTKLKITANFHQKFSTRNNIKLGYFWINPVVASMKTKLIKTFVIPTVKIVSVNKLLSRATANMSFTMPISVVGSMIKTYFKIKTFSIKVGKLSMSLSPMLGVFKTIGYYDPNTIGSMDSTNITSLDFTSS